MRKVNKTCLKEKKERVRRRHAVSEKKERQRATAEMCERNRGKAK